MQFLILCIFEDRHEVVNVPQGWLGCFVPQAVALGIQERIYNRESAKGRYVDVILIPQTRSGR